MYAIQTLMERLRPLVGSRGWDYCVFWKLNQDQSAIECVDCCCGGADVQYPQQEFDFRVSTICKDALFPHERSSSGACELLAQLPPSIALDSGIYAHTLLSNHPRWLNFASCSELNIREDTVGTKVLIPIAGGLIELFVAKQVPEDAQIIEFITAQCTGVVSMEGYVGNFPMMNNNNNTDRHQEGLDNVVNLQQHDLFLPTRHNSSGLVHGELENDASENSMMELQDNNNTQHIEFVEANMAKLGGISGSDHVQVRRGGGGGGRRSGSVSENEDEDHQLQAGNNNDEEEEEEKRPQSKNLVAERNRRKKLNDRLYTLRSLVPNISKLDRASIIGDAIEFIKELEKQQKDLQDELEEQSDIEDHHHHGINNQLGQGGRRNKFDYNMIMINRQPSNSSELVHTEVQPTDHINKPQQMEPQVEVNQIDGKEFFVKVFCEHKAGGFVRLMEALHSIGLQVKNANITSFRSLVSSIFTVEKKDSEVIQADHVKDSLLEVTRNVGSPVAWRARGDHHHINNTDADHLLVDPNPNPNHYSLLHNHLIY